MTPEAICPKYGTRETYKRRVIFGGKLVLDEEDGLYACDCVLSGICPYEDDMPFYKIEDSSDQPPKETPITSK